MILNEEDRQAIVAEIAEMTRPPALRPEEVTAAMVAEMEGILPRKASYGLEREWRKRRLRKRKVQVDSHRPWAYSKAPAVTDSVTNGDGDKPDLDGLRYAPYPKRG